MTCITGIGMFGLTNFYYGLFAILTAVTLFLAYHLYTMELRGWALTMHACGIISATVVALTFLTSNDFSIFAFYAWGLTILITVGILMIPASGKPKMETETDSNTAEAL